MPQICASTPPSRLSRLKRPSKHCRPRASRTALSYFDEIGSANLRSFIFSQPRYHQLPTNSTARVCVPWCNWSYLPATAARCLFTVPILPLAPDRLKPLRDVLPASPICQAILQAAPVSGAFGKRRMKTRQNAFKSRYSRRMSVAAEKMAEVLALSEPDRAFLARQLIASLDSAMDPDAETQWHEVIDRRSSEMAVGRVDARPEAEVVGGYSSQAHSCALSGILRFPRSWKPPRSGTRSANQDWAAIFLTISSHARSHLTHEPERWRKIRGDNRKAQLPPFPICDRLHLHTSTRFASQR